MEGSRVQLLGNGFGRCPPEWNVLAREARLPLAGEQPGGKPVRNISQAEGHLTSFTTTNSQGKGLLLLAAQAPNQVEV